MKGLPRPAQASCLLRKTAFVKSPEASCFLDQDLFQGPALACPCGLLCTLGAFPSESASCPGLPQPDPDLCSGWAQRDLLSRLVKS